MSREPRSRLYRFTLIVACLCFCCQSVLALEPSSPWPEATAVPWPEANQLFHRDLRWRGGDGAGSVDLGNERILWLFGDSFVSNQPVKRRSDTKMVNNSLGIQLGLNPEAASLKCFWNEEHTKPRAFFETNDDSWLWPAAGILLDDKLLVMMMRMERAEKGLGFRVIGNNGFIIHNPQDSPEVWDMESVVMPKYRFKIIYGSGGLAIVGGYLYSISPAVSKDHNGYLIRWSLANARRGNLSNPQWHDGDQWLANDAIDVLPRATISGAQTEYTVHRHDPHGFLFQVQCSPYLSAQVGVRYSSRWEGPWSGLKYIFDPRVNDTYKPGVFYYSGKAHPELAVEGLAVTYCCNSRSLKQVVDDESIYYPRFLRIAFEHCVK